MSNDQKPNQARMNATIKRIAKEEMGIETLQTRNSDGLDFYDTAVWSIKAALEEAYKAGMKAAREA
jgi:hypothetical protein